MRLDLLRAAATATEDAQSAHISEEAQKLRTAMQEAAQVLAAAVEQEKTA